MVDVDGSSRFPVDLCRKSVSLVWGLASTRCWVCIDEMNTGWTLAMTLVMVTTPSTYACVLLWLPYVIGQTIVFLPCDFYLSFFLFFPRLISSVGDWMSTILLHMVWPWCEFKMQVWNLLHAARWNHRTQKGRQKSPSGHHRTTSSGYIFANKACIDNRKKTC